MDILTGLVIWAAQALTLSVLLFAWWSRDQNQTYQLSWSGGFGMLGVGLILVGLRGEIPGFLSIDIANTLILLSIGVFIGGMLQFDGRRVEPFIIVPALLWIGGLLLPVVRETFSDLIRCWLRHAGRDPPATTGKIALDRQHSGGRSRHLHSHESCTCSDGSGLWRNLL